MICSVCTRITFRYTINFNIIHHVRNITPKMLNVVGDFVFINLYVFLLRKEFNAWGRDLKREYSCEA